MLPRFCFKIQIIDKCNLNCQGCDHFAPLADDNSFIQDLADYNKTITSLKKVVPNNVREIILYGGEPLLHPRLIDFLKITRILFPRIYLTVQTNAILLDDFLKQHAQYCRANKISFKITEYPPTIGILNKLHDKYPETFLEYTKNDDYEGIKGNGKQLLFNVSLDVNNPNIINRDDNRQRCYCKTYEQNSLCIRNNYIYACPLAMCTEIFDSYFKQPKLSNYVTKYNLETLTTEQILELSEHSTGFCALCNGINTRLPWQISKKQKSEWIKE